jgi:peptide/nickel transport system substrate-binding protein
MIGKPDTNSERLAVQITDSLVQYDAQMALVPRVAESWEIADGGRLMTFRLRDGVRWHDGRPVTAHDVVFTVEQVLDPAVESRSWSPMFQDLESIEALDDRTVRARYAVANPDVLDGWRVPLIPRHLAESGAELLTGHYAEQPIGCGPFRFLRHIPEQEIVLEANDDYWDGRPAVDRLVLRVFADQRTAYQALLLGELDVMTATPDLWRQLRESPRAGDFESFSYYRTSVWAIRWNQDGSNPYFTDERTRRAMLLALDREQFLDRMLYGQGRLGVTTYHPDLPWTDPDLEPLPYDPAAAGQLLDEVGWRRPAAGAIRERDGVAFRFSLMTAKSSQPIVAQMAAWLQQSWAEVGIQSEIDTLEWGHFRERRNGGDYEAAMGGISTTVSPDQMELYHSSMRETGWNFMAFSDPEVDELVTRGRTIFDFEARKKVYFRLQHRLHDLQPIGCLIYFATPVIHDRRLLGIQPAPIDYWRTSRGPRVWHWSDER